MEGRAVKTCPVCKMEIPDRLMVCPRCGHVMDVKGISPSLHAFIAELEEYDKLIGDAGRKESERRTAKERKVALIRNFTFGNDGKSILEALLFMKSRILDEAEGPMNRRSVYWIHLWSGKAETLYEKAKIMLPKNEFIEIAYTEMDQVRQRAEQTARRKAAVLGFTLLLAIAGMILYGMMRKSPVASPQETGKMVLWTEPSQAGPAPSEGDGAAASVPSEGDEATVSVPFEDGRDKKPVELPVTRKLLKEENQEDARMDLKLENFIFSVPEYWEEKGSKAEYYQAYAETGGRVALLSINYPTDEEDAVNLEALYADNENMITVVESWFHECKVTENEKFQSDYGVEGMLYTYTFRIVINDVEYGGKGQCLCFPSEEDNRWFFVNLAVTDNAEGDYTDDYRKILASIRNGES